VLDLPIDVSQYLICRKDCSLQYIESLALMGLVEKALVEDCDRKNFKKIVVKLYSGDEVVSECRFNEEVEQSLRVINVYIGINRRNDSWNKINIVESSEEKYSG